MKKTLLLPAALVIALTACKKEEVIESETQDLSPTITINDPMQSIYNVGDTAFVNVVIADEKEMHEAECWFITQPQNDTLWNISRHAHSNTITFNSYYIVDHLPEEQEVDFVVFAENDEGKTATKTHTFEVHDH